MSIGTGTIYVIQGLRIIGDNFNFPAPNSGPFGTGGGGMQLSQASNYIAMPPILAITTGQGTLLDLSALSVPIAGGGWIMYYNADDTNYVTFGPDSGGNIIADGEMLAGEFAGPYRLSRSQQKIRFKANTANCQVIALIAAP